MKLRTVAAGAKRTTNHGSFTGSAADVVRAYCGHDHDRTNALPMVQTATSRKPEYDSCTRSITTGNGEKLDDANQIGNIKVSAEVEAYCYDLIKQRRAWMMAKEEKEARQRAFINAQADMQHEEGSDTETDG